MTKCILLVCQSQAKCLNIQFLRGYMWDHPNLVHLDHTLNLVLIYSLPLPYIPRSQLACCARTQKMPGFLSEANTDWRSCSALTFKGDLKKSKFPLITLSLLLEHHNDSWLVSLQCYQPVMTLMNMMQGCRQVNMVGTGKKTHGKILWSFL